MYHFIEDILDKALERVEPIVIGSSRQGRPIHAYQFGSGVNRLSLIGGCHADEPTGPKLLRHLVSSLSKMPKRHQWLTGFSWWIVPHANPDGEAINQRWYNGKEDYYNLAKYLINVQREFPGDDVEFGFPIAGEISALRPENQAIYDFWKSAEGCFDLHISLHGMSMAQGPWFLIDQNWIDRSDLIQAICTEKVLQMNYRLHDLDRQGEKGFNRISQGFCTRPSAKAMKAYFNAKGQPLEAEKFHASSMESIRSLGGDCLTLVSEMPLFILPPDADISWPNPGWKRWQDQFQKWKQQLSKDQLSIREFEDQVDASGLKPMAIRDQMILQWHFFWSGVEQMLRFKT